MTIRRPNPPRNRLVRFAYLMGQRYLRHQVGLHSAALAFYLLFAIFPLLISFSAIVGMLHLDVIRELPALAELLPPEILRLLQRYLNYISRNPSPRLMTFGLVFSLYFPLRAANSLMRAVREAYHLGRPSGAVLWFFKTLLYTILLIVGILSTIVLMTVSNRILDWAVENLGLPPFWADLWAGLRFPIVTAVGFFALFLLYAMAQDSRPARRDLWPGTAAALCGWTAASWLYTWYVNNVAQYSLLYGSIGTMIVLMIWLNLSAMILIMGAEWNGTLMSLRKEQAEFPGN